MKNLSFRYDDCKEIIDAFGKDEIEKHFESLFKDLEKYVEVNNLDGRVEINRVLLGTAVIDYFYDILRIKTLHKYIEKVNSEKVIAYTSYWLLQRKPLIFIPEKCEINEDLSTVNERFILQYITDYLSERVRKKHIVMREEKGVQNFVKSLLYYLFYRKYDAQSLEMIIIAFMGGQIYEQTDIDISEEMHPFDSEREQFHDSIHS